MEAKSIKTPPDKFLIAIVAGIVLLVGVAIAVVLLRPKPAYQTDDSPDAAAHNYLFAVQQADYPRAYGYLSPGLEGYPGSVDQFTADVTQNNYNFGVQNGSTTLEVVSSEISGPRATVTVRETDFSEGGLFNSSQYVHPFVMTLRREGSQWKIIDSEAYWVWCWSGANGCGS